MVGLRDGQSDGLEPGLGQLGHAVLQKHLAEMMAAPASGDAELGDVGDVIGYMGTKDHADEGSVPGVAEDP